MGKRSNFKREYTRLLNEQTHYSESKSDKKEVARKEAAEKGIKPEPIKGIYSTSTFNSYAKVCRQYSEFLIEKHPEVKRFTDGKKYVGEWLREKEELGLSAWTIAKYGSALARAYDVSKNDFDYAYPKRSRSDIKRNRGETPERYLADKYNDARIFSKATGARRCELLRVRREDIRESDGHLEVFLKGKNRMTGWRIVLPEYEADIKRIFSTHKGLQISTDKGIEDRLFEKKEIPSNLHQHRAEYACGLYDYFMEHDAATGKYYHCRDDRRGESFDRGCLIAVSEMMFHHREDVVVNNYLYGYFNK